eukprot:gene14104-21591_t
MLPPPGDGEFGTESQQARRSYPTNAFGPRCPPFSPKKLEFGTGAGGAAGSPPLVPVANPHATRVPTVVIDEGTVRGGLPAVATRDASAGPYAIDMAGFEGPPQGRKPAPLYVRGELVQVRQAENEKLSGRDAAVHLDARIIAAHASSKRGVFYDVAYDALPTGHPMHGSQSAFLTRVAQDHVRRATIELQDDTFAEMLRSDGSYGYVRILTIPDYVLKTEGGGDEGAEGYSGCAVVRPCIGAKEEGVKETVLQAVLRRLAPVSLGDHVLAFVRDARAWRECEVIGVSAAGFRCDDFGLYAREDLRVKRPAVPPAVLEECIKSLAATTPDGRVTGAALSDHLQNAHASVSALLAQPAAVREAAAGGTQFSRVFRALRPLPSVAPAAAVGLVLRHSTPERGGGARCCKPKKPGGPARPNGGKPAAPNKRWAALGCLPCFAGSDSESDTDESREGEPPVADDAEGGDDDEDASSTASAAEGRVKTFKRQPFTIACLAAASACCLLSVVALLLPRWRVGRFAPPNDDDVNLGLFTISVPYPELRQNAYGAGQSVMNPGSAFEHWEPAAPGEVGIEWERDDMPSVRGASVAALLLLLGSILTTLCVLESWHHNAPVRFSASLFASGACALAAAGVYSGVLLHSFDIRADHPLVGPGTQWGAGWILAMTSGAVLVVLGVVSALRAADAAAGDLEKGRYFDELGAKKWCPSCKKAAGACLCNTGACECAACVRPAVPLVLEPAVVVKWLPPEQPPVPAPAAVRNHQPPPPADPRPERRPQPSPIALPSGAVPPQPPTNPETPETLASNQPTPKPPPPAAQPPPPPAAPEVAKPLENQPPPPSEAQQQQQQPPPPPAPPAEVPPPEAAAPAAKVTRPAGGGVFDVNATVTLQPPSAATTPRDAGASVSRVSSFSEKGPPAPKQAPPTFPTPAPKQPAGPPPPKQAPPSFPASSNPLPPQPAPPSFALAATPKDAPVVLDPKGPKVPKSAPGGPPAPKQAPPSFPFLDVKSAAFDRAPSNTATPLSRPSSTMLSPDTQPNTPSERPLATNASVASDATDSTDLMHKSPASPPAPPADGSNETESRH